MPKIDLELKHAFRAVRTKVEVYGVRVYIGDVADPNTGTFNGSEIGIDYANELEMSLFVLVHLFGHTVQWNVVPAYRTIDERVKPFAASEIIEEARIYEDNASRDGLTLLHEAGMHDRDRWRSDWGGSEWRYVSTYSASCAWPAWNDSLAIDVAL